MGLWKSIRDRFSRYDLEKLIDYQNQNELGTVNYQRAIICDIDKTYLETQFSSFIDIAKIAFEEANDKVTVAGAGEILKLLRWEPSISQNSSESKIAPVIPCALHFISSSPPQLRTILQDKLMLDGLDWTSDTFKNQAYNILKGKLALLRQHIGYKSKAILKVMNGAPQGSHFYFIGDNVETDPFIYLGIFLLTQGFITLDGYYKFLNIANLSESIISSVLSEANKLRQQTAEGIFIRNNGEQAFLPEPPLSDPICFFDHFYIAGLNMITQGILPVHILPNLIRIFHNNYDYDLAQSLFYAQQMNRYLRGEEQVYVEDHINLLRESIPGLKASMHALTTQKMNVKIHPITKKNLQPLSEEQILGLCRTWFRNYVQRSGR